MPDFIIRGNQGHIGSFCIVSHAENYLEVHEDTEADSGRVYGMTMKVLIWSLGKYYFYYKEYVKLFSPLVSTTEGGNAILERILRKYLKMMLHFDE